MKTRNSRDIEKTYPLPGFIAKLRQLAYEMAVCVCDADGVQSEAEKSFLAGVRRELKLGEQAAALVDGAAEALAVEPLADAALPPKLTPPSAADEQVEKMIGRRCSSDCTGPARPLRESCCCGWPSRRRWPRSTP